MGQGSPRWPLRDQVHPGPVLPGGPDSSVARTAIFPPLPPEETAHAGPGREPSKPPLARPGVGVYLCGPLGRREGGGTESSGFSSSPSGNL